VIAMPPIRFTCVATLPFAPEEIAAQILDLAEWTNFRGYGQLPGIKTAEFEVRTLEVIGTRIRVTDTDGSNHIEEIIEWQPDRRIGIEMKDFSPPLSRLATNFLETWDFVRLDQGTRATRSFELYAKSRLTRPALWLISLLLRRAIARHFHQMLHLPTAATNR
jgi:hypothetical protein